VKHIIKNLFVLLLLALWLLGGTRSSARELPALQVAVNQSLVFRLVEKARRISVAQPEIAEVIVAEPNQLVVNGKAVGITSLIVWDDKGQFTNFTVIVTTDIDSLRLQLKTLFPEENIEVSSSGLGIVLQGEVANEVVYDKVIAVTRNYLPPKPPQDVAPAPASTTTFTIGEGVRLPTTGTAFAGGGELAFVEEGGVTDSRRWKDKRGIPEIIDMAAGHIENYRGGFKAVFSEAPFPGHQIALDHVREDEMSGNWYRLRDTEMEGWLCPALFKYFEAAPKSIYVEVKPI